ncbi:AraC family transcriptional regulator [Levilactobacillus namurensis]|uniref:AraC family transcriptional regulator n=1 Tax=Levilactobacillus namurensis TaxID=380393 RepID=A0AAW8W5Y6_9LACO|nr:AraC family transcriptional regulator [Levilactobacillus namurensis]MDT7014942.1 AraC family transcriptional regulator [Levilactobacillus namurensis]
MPNLPQKVYKFEVDQPFTLFKSGEYFASAGWRHKDITNHGDYELFIMITGKVYIKIGAQQFELGPHDCLLIPPFIRHIGYRGSPDHTNYYWLHFFPNGSVTSSFTKEKHGTNSVLIPQKMHIRHFDRVTILARQVLDSANNQTTLPVTANYFVTSLTIELANQFSAEKTNQSIVGSTKFEFIKNWIKIHSHESLTVNTIADHFDISPTYLTLLFRTHENQTTIAYINQIKIEQAEQLLLTTDLSIKQIADQLSFQNEKYFFRVFKKVTQTTPSKFRNSYSRTYLNNINVDPDNPQLLDHLKDED